MGAGNRRRRRLLRGLRGRVVGLDHHRRHHCYGVGEEGERDGVVVVVVVVGCDCGCGDVGVGVGDGRQGVVDRGLRPPR